MDFLLFGSLEARSDERAMDLGPPKQRALLAILLLHVGEIVTVDRLTELLWGDNPPRTAAHSIQVYVSDLRKVLEPPARRQVMMAAGSPSRELITSCLLPMETTRGSGWLGPNLDRSSPSSGLTIRSWNNLTSAEQLGQGKVDT